MNKRILSILLALVMCVGLLPMAAFPASAASELVPSDDCINAIKKWEGFSAKPYWDYSQWTVGYGTRVPDGMLDTYKANGITQEEADILLREHLESTAKSLNSFCDKYSLTMDQGQFDALISLSFNCGTAWLYRVSTLRTAIIEGWTGNDLLFALGQWSTAGGSTLPALIRRRMAEANMYMNGVYSTSVPENFCYVRFNANGGTSEIITQCYDSNVPDTIRAVPQYEGYQFEGWYTDPTGGEKITTLDAGVRNYTLYAHWSAGSGADLPQEDTTAEITGDPVDYSRQVATGVLNSFVQPVKGALVAGAYKLDEVVKITAEYTDGSGVKWGKVENGGWINLSYTREPSSNEQPTQGVKVTVTNNAVNVRRGPGTGYARVGSVNKGDTMTITETANGSGYFWGKYEKGWIALKYTNYDSVVNGAQPAPEAPAPSEPEADTPAQPEGSETVIATGKVAVTSGKLNIRKGPGTGYASVGGLSKGTAVSIYERKTVGTMEWGRIDQGWISLTYVRLDAQSEQEAPPQDNENAGSQEPETAPPATEAPPATQEPPAQETPPSQEDSPDTEPDTPQPESPAAPEAGQTVSGKVNTTSGRLHIRKGPGTNYSVVGSLAKGAAVTITEQTTVNGTVWGKTDAGWVCMNYIQLDTAQAPAERISATVNSGDARLRIRGSASTSATIVGYYNHGDRIQILEKKTVGGVQWGRTDKGWISMEYVVVDGQSATPEESAPDAVPSRTVTITASCLLIRSDAGTSNKIVGRLYNGDKIAVTETKDVAGVQWGKTAKGWICMDYTK